MLFQSVLSKTNHHGKVFPIFLHKLKFYSFPFPHYINRFLRGQSQALNMQSFKWLTGSQVTRYEMWHQLVGISWRHRQFRIWIKYGLHWNANWNSVTWKMENLSQRVTISPTDSLLAIVKILWNQGIDRYVALWRHKRVFAKRHLVIKIKSIYNKTENSIDETEFICCKL